MNRVITPQFDAPVVRVHNLEKTFRVPVRQPGMQAAVHSIFKPEYSDVRAVRSINFSIRQGEMVGFIGPNGAGKTTTLKMLSGLIFPTTGEATVAGFVPWQRKADFLRRISMVLGNKSQMIWDIPPLDSFLVLGEIYKIPAARLRRNIDELADLLEMKDLLKKPVRNLSLGERMKCELTAGLIHDPEVLFLDEPTLGLDVSMQARLREFIKEFNRRRGATVILTSHYMADVTSLCERVILIHNGGILYDGGLEKLATRMAPFKLVNLTLAADASGVQEKTEIPKNVDLISSENGRRTFRVDRAGAPAAVAALLATYPVVDLSVEDPPIEAVIDQVYQGGVL